MRTPKQPASRPHLVRDLVLTVAATAGVVVVLMYVAVGISTGSWWLIREAATPDKRTDWVGAARIAVPAATLLAAAAAAVLAVHGQRTRLSELAAVRDANVTERYTRAIDQVGSDKLMVRIGGIYALERIALDSTADRPSVCQVLEQAIRQWAARVQRTMPVTCPDADTTDVLAAMGTLSRLSSLAGSTFDLTDFNGEGLLLTQAQLANARLKNSSLSGADLMRATLQGAILTEADLSSAILVGCAADGAVMHRTNLQQARLQNAKLGSADLEGADLTNANLRGAHMENATLTNAYFGDADLRGSFLGCAPIPDSVDFPGAKLKNADRCGRRLPDGELTSHDLNQPTVGSSSHIAVSTRRWPIQKARRMPPSQSPGSETPEQ